MSDPHLPSRRPVLVTGGAGFIGHHLVADLLARGEAVTVLDDLSTGGWASLPEHPALRRVTGCVTRGPDVAAAVSAHGPGGVARVYHLAGVVGVRRAVAQAARAHDVAVTGTRRVLEATGDAPAVLFSSSAVYGLSRAGRAREDTPLTVDDARAYDGGVDGYAVGKLRLERLGAEAAAGGRAVLTLRPFNVVGPGQVGAYGMVLPRFVAAALRGRPLEVYDDGAQRRAFSAVGTFLSALRRLEARPEAWSGAINVGAPHGTSVLELARAVVDAVAARHGTRAPIRHRPYDEVFPGRTDVRARVPVTTRLDALAGPLHWPDVPALVDDLVEDLDERLVRRDGPSRQPMTPQPITKLTMRPGTATTLRT